MLFDEDSKERKKEHLAALPDGSFEIYKTEARALYYVVAAALFAVAALYFNKSGNNVVSYIFFAGFAGAAAYSLSLVLFKKPLLTITDTHITYYTLGKLSETILLEDVEEFREMRVKNEHFIGIIVKNPEEILESQTNKLIYKLMRINLKAYGTPFIIPTDSLSVHRKEILNVLEQKLEEYYIRTKSI